MTRLRELLDRSQRAALVAWLLVAGLAGTIAVNGFRGNLLWAGFALAATLLVVVPSVLRYDPAVTLPWAVVAMVFLPVLVRSLVITGMVGRVATYASVAAVALVLAVELDAFSPVQLTPTLGVVFVVLTTMAAAALWTIVLWTANVVAETGFFEGIAQMMWYLVGATAAGLLAGALFELYFREEDSTAGLTETAGKGST